MATKITKITKLNLLAPAKLNLGLKITGRRSDGYHLLKTIFCLIDLYDNIDLELDLSGTISLIDHHNRWSEHSDLTYKAAVLLKQSSQSPLGVKIRLKKNIPEEMGLGGGSSDAAQVLLGLNQLWQTGMGVTELSQLGQMLGADVPFFLYGANAALAEGVGEILSPIKTPKLHFVLIKPPFNLSTKAVFNKFDEVYYYDLQNKSDDTTYTTLELLNTKHNDLLAIATIIYPELALIINELNQYQTPAMTGSGSGLYLTFDDINIAKKVASKLQSRYNTYLVNSLNPS